MDTPEDDFTVDPRLHFNSRVEHLDGHVHASELRLSAAVESAAVASEGGFDKGLEQPSSMHLHECRTHLLSRR
jgi:hypothetical protein